MQILSLVVIFYIISMAVSTVSMYYSSRNSFLSAKEDMIERDLDNLYTRYFEYPELLPWFFDYCRDRAEEVSIPSTRAEDTYVLDAYEEISNSGKNVDEYLKSQSEENKLALARSFYRMITYALDSNTEVFKYGGMMCMDIRKNNCGFVYYEAMKNENDINSTLGEKLDVNIDDHPAMKKLLEGDYDKLAFEIAPAEWETGENYYIGYLPIVDDNEVKAVFAIDFNWDDFHTQLMNQIWLMAGLMLAGMLVCCLLMLILVDRIAIKPLSNVQKTVRQYMGDKDSDAAQELLKKIKTRNEIGVLADDVGALTKEITQYTEHIKTLTTEVMEALAQTIDAKDKYTNGHSFRVAMYSMMLAKELGMSKQQQIDIYYMGLLHDIGKIGIPNAIINKTTKLTDEEYDKIKQHPVYGYDILSQIQSMPELSIGARYHHERIDGKGYPDGLTGDQIPFMARIIAVADSYDTMTSNRSYRKYLPQEVARSEIENNIGTQFDEVPARAMLKIIDADKHYMLHE